MRWVSQRFSRLNSFPKKVSGASDDAPLFDEYLIFCPTVDSEKYSSWIELTGFSLLFSFGQIHDPEKFFFPFYDLLALFFPSIPCRFLFSRPRTNFRFSDLPSFHLIRSEYCSFALSWNLSLTRSKKFFQNFRFEKFFSNCQRLCSFWMRFEGFRASDKISVQQLVTFHCVSRFIPALEINRLWKEFLFLDRKQFRIFSYRLGGGISSREILVPKELWFRSRFGIVHRSNWYSFVQRNFLLETFLWSGR